MERLRYYRKGSFTSSQCSVHCCPHSPCAHGTSEQAQWHRIAKMLDNLQTSVQSECLDRGHVISQLRKMQTGDILAFFVRPQNAGIILTKHENCTLYESFEVSPSGDAVNRTAGSLICSYPRSAVEVPIEVFDDADFQLEFASFLSRPGAVDSDLPLPLTIHSQWIASLLTGIMRSVGHVVDVPRITKRVRGHDSWSQNDHEAKLSAAIIPEPRVPGFANQDEWLFIRVAIQMAVRQSPLRRAAYKGFMLFFVCTLAGDADNTKLYSDLLHLKFTDA
ncbi:hypothetical protein EV363DRAFT_1169212 [Boletus edulis]|nr:hypothetical protein EV363DRAFT_1169212 [Boletus edulis]